MSPLLSRSVAGLSLLLALTGLAALAGCLLGGAVPWFTVCFELVVLVAAVYGWLVARGWYADGRAMTLVCVAGTIFVATYLGYLGCNGQLAGQSLKAALLLRVALAGAFGVAAAAVILVRDPKRSIPPLVKGTVMLAVPALLAAAYWRGIGAAQLASIDGTLKAGLIGVALMVGGVLLAVGAHLVIRAFELGLKAGETK